jgi:hypothetical protein
MLVQDRSRVVDEFGRRSWRTSSSDYNNNRGESKAIRAHILDDGIKICADVQSSASHRIVPRSIKTPHNGRLQEHSLGPKSERFRGTFCRDSANPGRDRSSEEEGAAVRPSVRTQQSSDLLLLVAPECTLFALGRKRGATNKFREPCERGSLGARPSGSGPGTATVIYERRRRPREEMCTFLIRFRATRSFKRREREREKISRNVEPAANPGRRRINNEPRNDKRPVLRPVRRREPRPSS